MTPREIVAACFGTLFGYAWGALCLLLLVSEIEIMDWIAALNWFACWVCLALGVVVGMAISAMFMEPS
ncbi:hypothetical protein [Ideonella sp.]|uniref:hypothetical protein n=1 Tax=Ideonella sp. TaxID=1929293 RepID=UPI003BB56BD6